MKNTIYIIVCNKIISKKKLNSKVEIKISMVYTHLINE